ncbi:hypothetical protein ACFOGJ_07915 [Marinibaculum pumilum]|uniref:Uncharacterized protein n=1 Tax=Marinibaculum pumilum TaxID=1766165 RepID=A0ABV7KXU6_9PROT
MPFRKVVLPCPSKSGKPFIRGEGAKLNEAKFVEPATRYLVDLCKERVDFAAQDELYDLPEVKKGQETRRTLDGMALDSIGRWIEEGLFLKNANVFDDGSFPRLPSTFWIIVPDGFDLKMRGEDGTLQDVEVPVGLHECSTKAWDPESGEATKIVLKIPGEPVISEANLLALLEGGAAYVDRIDFCSLPFMEYKPART